MFIQNFRILRQGSGWIKRNFHRYKSLPPRCHIWNHSTSCMFHKMITFCRTPAHRRITLWSICVCVCVCSRHLTSWEAVQRKRKTGREITDEECRMIDDQWSSSPRNLKLFSLSPFFALLLNPRGIFIWEDQSWRGFRCTLRDRLTATCTFSGVSSSTPKWDHNPWLILYSKRDEKRPWLFHFGVLFPGLFFHHLAYYVVCTTTYTKMALV